MKVLMRIYTGSTVVTMMERAEKVEALIGTRNTLSGKIYPFKGYSRKEELKAIVNVLDTRFKNNIKYADAIRSLKTVCLFYETISKGFKRRNYDI